MKDNQQVQLKAFTLLFAVLPLCTLGAAQTSVKPQARIINGQVTTISAVPYLLNLRVNGGFRCGASLVTTTHAVTAAHCVKDVPASQVTIVGGASRLSETGVVRGVQRIFLPSTYNSNSMTWDVAVLRLRSPMTGANIRTIPLCSQALFGGQNSRISGWGLTSENGNISNDVRTVVIPLVAKQTCINSYRYVARLTNTMLCASTSARRDSCSGDSGGPLVVNGQLCGIVSWGIGCANPNYPGIYTNVNVVRNYILNSIAAT